MPEKRKTSDAMRTYRYLRIGMISSVVLLGAAVVEEGMDRDGACWETSISAYWYTPAKPVLVGVLMAIGFAMIVIKGRGTFEDTALNFAGMFAPIVALVPTTAPDDHTCDITAPPTSELAEMVENSVSALLFTGAFCIAAAFLIALVLHLLHRGDVRSSFADTDRGTWITLGGAAALVGLAIWLNRAWDYEELTDNAHGSAAGLMFLCMFAAALSAAWRATKRWQEWAYGTTAFAMLAGGLVAGLAEVFGAHEILALEAWEILWFGVFWAVQTVERWNEPPEGSSVTVPVAATATTAETPIEP